jgi:6-phosphogluconolactonase
MRNLLAALGGFAIALIGCKGDGSAAPAARNAPFVLAVPYFTVVGDARAAKSISVYRVDATTGALTLVPGSPFAAGNDPTADAIVPSGRFAYVVNKGSSSDLGSVSAYRINTITGALMPVAGSPFRDDSINEPTGVTIDPAGKFAYVVSSRGVSAFSIDGTTGVLRRVQGSPFTARGSDGFGTVAIALDPSGRFAYVLNQENDTISPYAVDAATGMLKAVGSPREAGRGGNGSGPFSVTVDSIGKFAYVTDPYNVYVYAISATTGALAPPAHIKVDQGDLGDVAGFAIDRTSKFAYAVDSNRVYAYTIDPTSGILKAVPGRGFAVRTGTDTGHAARKITLEPTGNFAYVFDDGDSIYGYKINASNGTLTPVTHSPFAIPVNNTDPIARWFNAGRCAVFNEAAAWSGRQPPYVKDGEDYVANGAEPLLKQGQFGIIIRRAGDRSAYYYDPRGHFAVHYPIRDVGGSFTLRTSGPPPPAVPQHDLSKLHTVSGIKLGSSAATVVSLLGQPKIVNGCGLQRYVYLRSREGEPLSLQFTIGKGRVIEIFEDFGG